MVSRVQLSRLVLRRQIVEKIKQERQPDEGESRDDHITSMRLMRDACVTEGTTGAEGNQTTALRGSACGIRGGVTIVTALPTSTKSLACA